MAIQFLTGLNIQGNVNLNESQLQNFIVHPLAANPTGIAGRVYYNSANNVLRLYDGSQWVDITTGADDDTTYDLSGYGGNNGASGIQLVGSDSTTDQVAITGTGNTTVTRSGNTLTVNSSDSFVGTVTSVDVSGGTTGLTTSGGPVTSSGTITLAGTLNEVSGGTGQSTYTTGDILYASASNTLAKLAIGSTGQVLKVAGGIPSWAADSNTGLTSVGITETGDALTITNTPLTANGDINIAGAGTSSQVILGDLTLAALPVDGVTSVGLSMPAAFTVTNSPVTSTGNLTVTGAGTTSQVVLGDGSLGTLPVNGVTSIGITPGTGLDVSNSPVTSSGNIGITLDLSELPTVTSIDPAADFLVGVDGTANEKILYQNVHLNQWGDAEADVDFGGNKLLDVATGTAGTDGVNLAQVQSIAAGVGVFQGGYDANANSPALTGASNVALVQGDFFVVTTAGTAFFSQDLEVGDLIFANAVIPANSSPALSDYTVVIADQNIAGVGATDGATEKGVAGFSSASFAGTASGFITIKAGGISDAQLASTFNKIIGTDTDLDTSGVEVVDQINVTDGVITSMSKRTLPDATTTAVGVTEIATQAEVDAGTDNFRYVTPLTLKTAVGKQAFSDTYPATITNSWTIDAATHGLGATQGPFVIQTYISGAQVYIDVAIASNGTITFTTTNNQAVDAVVCNIMKVN